MPSPSRRRHVAIRALLEPSLRARLSGKRRDALVFRASDGGYLRNGNWRSRSGWSTATKELGIEGVTPHDLRRTFGSSRTRRRLVGEGDELAQDDPGHVLEVQQSEAVLVGVVEHQPDRRLLGLVEHEHLRQQRRPQGRDRRPHRDALAEAPTRASGTSPVSVPCGPPRRRCTAAPDPCRRTAGPRRTRRPG